MNKILLTSALAASIVAPTAIQAQALPAAVIAVADLDRVTAECTACKTASASLRSQAAALQAREKALVDPMQAEQKSIQAAIDALKSAAPDAALQARVRAFQTRQQQASDELQKSQAQIQRNQQYIQQQVATKLGPIYQQVMQRRGATILIETGATLAASSSIDVTNEVLAALNVAMPTLATTAPAQAQQKPQGR
ncbi:MAG: OmpH family outer membrane protein [Sphingomicrobium sp.]